MASMVMVVQVNCMLLLLVMAAGYEYYERHFRFDYEFDDEAEGWLKYHEIPSTWADARMHCHAEGAVLASPLSEQLKAAILTFVKKHDTFSYQPFHIFTGVHATISKGVYSSIEGVPLRRLAVSWALGEPNNRDNSEDCLVMLVGENGTMADEMCDGLFPYVCYKKKAVLTVAECGTTDLKYNLEKDTGSCYKVHTKIRTWQDAYKICAAEGAYLAIINSNVEAEAVKKIIRNHSNKNFNPVYSEVYNIGYYDWDHQQNFMTIHGETLNEAGYQNWEVGQPNNLTRTQSGDYGQMCGAINKNGRLDDMFCNTPSYFLCEMTPNSLR